MYMSLQGEAHRGFFSRVSPWANSFWKAQHHFAFAVREFHFCQYGQQYAIRAAARIESVQATVVCLANSSREVDSRRGFPEGLATVVRPGPALRRYSYALQFMRPVGVQPHFVFDPVKASAIGRRQEVLAGPVDRLSSNLRSPSDNLCR